MLRQWIEKPLKISIRVSFCDISGRSTYSKTRRFWTIAEAHDWAKAEIERAKHPAFTTYVLHPVKKGADDYLLRRCRGLKIGLRCLFLPLTCLVALCWGIQIGLGQLATLLMWASETLQLLILDDVSFLLDWQDHAQAQLETTQTTLSPLKKDRSV